MRRSVYIAVDVLERSAVPAKLAALGATVAREPLPVGDYRVGSGTLVDRVVARSVWVPASPVVSH